MMGEELGALESTDLAGVCLQQCCQHLCGMCLGEHRLCIIPQQRKHADSAGAWQLPGISLTRGAGHDHRLQGIQGCVHRWRLRHIAFKHA